MPRQRLRALLCGRHAHLLPFRIDKHLLLPVRLHAQHVDSLPVRKGQHRLAASRHNRLRRHCRLSGHRPVLQPQRPRAPTRQHGSRHTACPPAQPHQPPSPLLPPQPRGKRRRHPLRIPLCLQPQHLPHRLASPDALKQPHMLLTLRQPHPQRTLLPGSQRLAQNLRRHPADNLFLYSFLVFHILVPFCLIDGMNLEKG